jgi:hypothetical protein
MNAVEIEEAISALAERPFEAGEFPFAFLQAFGNKETTLKRLRKGESNRSDLGGVLQTNNIHLAVAAPGEVTKTLAALKATPATARAKAKFILATDGEWVEAEDLASGDTVACAYADFPDHFGFFLALAGITTVRQIAENAFDIRATSRLNKLYVELLKDNPEWGEAARRHDMNHFMARLIFCFFAEDTDIFNGAGLFTATIEQMSNAANTDFVISEIFRAMNTPIKERGAAGLRPWADAFPYVNGGLFSGSLEVPRFSRIARSYLLHIGNLDWTKINPDIFGSMIQAVAEDEERGALGLHYTSVPNILKVLNPLFLDELRARLDEAGDNPRTLLNLRRRLARIRVFDPACGSGNFLVIAYKEMRAIEAEINQRRHESGRKSDIPLTNFRGIEMRDFPAVFGAPLDQPQIDFENEGGETYLCGNPPYRGSKWQTEGQKAELDAIFGHRTKSWKSLDYVAGWFIKAADYGTQTNAASAFVSTNSICQGIQVPILWPLIFDTGHQIHFAHTSFKWANLASHNAGVTVAIVGMSNHHQGNKFLFSLEDGTNIVKETEHINAYLVAGRDIDIQPSKRSISECAYMDLGNMPKDGGNLLLTFNEAQAAVAAEPSIARFIYDFVGSQEFVRGIVRSCLWIEDDEAGEAVVVSIVAARLEGVRKMRLESEAESTREFADRPHRFKQIQGRGIKSSIVIPKVTSETRPYLPVGVLSAHSIVSDNAFALYDAPLWNMALIASRLHLVWIATVCGKLETRYRYSNTLGWNTFPVPVMTDKNKADLTRCAEDILLAREAHFPATIAELYEPEKMPADLRAAHERNDEVLERIYIGRRFRNDTERLEKLFELYVKMTADKESPGKKVGRKTAA